MSSRLKIVLSIVALLIVFALVVVGISAVPAVSNEPGHPQRQHGEGGTAGPVQPEAAIAGLPPPPAALARLTAPDPGAQGPNEASSGRAFDVRQADPGGEVCGVDPAPAGSAEAAVLAQEAEARSAEAAARLFGLMAGSPNPVVRAAALLGADQREALAIAARQTGDAAVYAFALQACSREGAQPAACAQLSPLRMAALDPLNVVPWLWVAEEAEASGNAQGVAEAVHRASLAVGSRLREYAFADLALSAIPVDWPTRDVALASAHVLRIHADLRLPSYLAVFNHCSLENARDFNVRQTCDRLARVLVERGDTIVDMGIGRRLGERAGWPTETLELLEARHTAYKRFALDFDTPAAGSSQGSCGQLLRNVQKVLGHAREGEMHYARGRRAELGITDDQALLEFRKLRQAASAPR